jgi:hypothetical protein
MKGCSANQSSYRLAEDSSLSALTEIAIRQSNLFPEGKDTAQIASL